MQVYDKNPFIVRGGSGEEVPVTKVWISDIPISVDGKDIETALVRLGCVLRSSLINEKIRNKDGKLTRFLTIPDWPAVCVRQHPGKAFGKDSKDRGIHRAPVSQGTAEGRPTAGNVLQVLGERTLRLCVSKQHPMQKVPPGGSQAW